MGEAKRRNMLGFGGAVPTTRQSRREQVIARLADPAQRETAKNVRVKNRQINEQRAASVRVGDNPGVSFIK
jgi:hypothetical protein